MGSLFVVVVSQKWIPFPTARPKRGPWTCGDGVLEDMERKLSTALPAVTSWKVSGSGKDPVSFFFACHGHGEFLGF